jgi:hypothetical protein
MIHKPRLQRNRLATAMVALIIFIVSTLSFFGNYFIAANPRWFAEHQLDSEQLVLDGILHYADNAPKAPLILGRYSRPDISEQYKLAHSLYEESNRDGVFGEYHSQYGLQVKVFGLLASRGFSLSALQFFVASGLGICASAIYLILRRSKFSGLCSAAFPICMAFSPWVIVFARNLYWVEFTWFLPSIVTALYATVLGDDRCPGKLGSRTAMLFSFALFATVLIKLLCGYEYITTIYFAALISFIGLAMRGKVWTIYILRSCLAISLIFALAFVSSIGIHARQLESLGKPGFSTILLTASKRASAANPSSMFEKLCNQAEDLSGFEDCKKNYISAYSKSLSSNPLRVAYGYLFVPSFLPWLHDYTVVPAPLSQHEKSILRNSLGDLKRLRPDLAVQRLVSLPLGAYKKVAQRVQLKILQIIQKISFPLFLCVILVVFWPDRPILGYLAALFAGSASWYFAAKGHSYIHYHMNYVLWYVVFLPASFVLLVERVSANGGRYLASKQNRSILDSSED